MDEKIVYPAVAFHSCDIVRANGKQEQKEENNFRSGYKFNSQNMK